MAGSITICGIKNCDTMKKARTWMDKHGVAYSFHDYKAAGIDRERLERWCKKVGWETLLNRAGTTFRKLPDKDKAGLDAKESPGVDAGSTVHDQTAGSRPRRRQSDRRILTGALRPVGGSRQLIEAAGSENRMPAASAISCASTSA
jgi:hypothetical protein